MIVKTGIDIIEVNRIKENIEKYEHSFLNRIYTEKEIQYCESKNVQKYQSYSARFVAKEAVFKAVSSFLNNKYEIDWKNIEILNDKNGRPFVNLKIDESNIKDNVLNNLSIEISLSHIKDMAVASVVVFSE